MVALLLLLVQQDVEALIDDLDDDSVGVRDSAERALLQIGSRAVPALRRSKLPIARQIAGRIEWEPYVPIWFERKDPAIFARLEDPDPERAAAAFFDIATTAGNRPGEDERYRPVVGRIGGGSDHEVCGRVEYAVTVRIIGKEHQPDIDGLVSGAGTVDRETGDLDRLDAGGCPLDLKHFDGLLAGGHESVRRTRRPLARGERAGIRTSSSEPESPGSSYTRQRES